jgi:uncharacterized membrane protein YcaP (DUF421 family)
MSLSSELALVFGEKGAVDAGQECARAALVLLAGWAMIRLMGRRAFGRWSALDIVVSIVVGSNLSRALTGNAPLWGTLAATAVIFGLHQLVAVLCASHPGVSHLVEGRSIRLGEGGRLIPPAMLRHGISEADINEALRQSGLTDPGAAELVTLEPSGKITILKSKG